MKYRKKPVVIEAFQWTGGPDQTEDPVWAVDAIRSGVIRISDRRSPLVVMMIETLEGTMIAYQGDWIIKGIEGELYPCKPDIFEESYEPALEGEPQ